MILVSFSSADDALFNDVKKYDTVRSQGTENLPFHFFGTPGAYCIKLLLEKNSGYFNQSFFSYGKVNGKNHANPSFQILPEFFSGKSFIQWAPGVVVCTHYCPIQASETILNSDVEENLMK